MKPGAPISTLITIERINHGFNQGSCISGLTMRLRFWKPGETCFSVSQHADGAYVLERKRVSEEGRTVIRLLCIVLFPETTSTLLAKRSVKLKATVLAPRAGYHSSIFRPSVELHL